MVSDTTREVADKVAAALYRSGMSKRSLSAATGIPETTLLRKINANGDFGVSELVRIAKALDVPASEIAPSAFVAKAVA
ncbi:MAG: hypothetical protein QM635_11410 [Microbacteriaceae bacterium]